MQLDFNHQPLSIPTKFATTVKAHQAGQKTVINIQDLHCNYEVQQHIQAILRHLTKHYNLKIIAQEGAVGLIDTSVISQFPNQKIKKAVGNYFMQQGRLTGADVFAATSGHTVELVGIEDQGLYQQSLDKLHGFLNAQTQGLVLDLRDGLNLVRNKVYNKSLAQLESVYQDYRHGRIDTFHYIRYVTSRAAQWSLDLQPYQVLGQLTDSTFHQSQSEIDQAALFKELEHLELALRRQVYTSDLQAQVDRLSRRLDIIEKLINISATPEDVSAFRAQRQAFQVKTFTDFINKQLDDHYFRLAGLDLQELDRQLEQVNRFYDLADARSRAFVDQLEQWMDAKGEQLAVMINGGFHAEKVQAELAKRQISYLSVKPHIANWDIINPYFDILKNRKLPIEHLLEKNQTVLTPPNALLLPRLRHAIGWVLTAFGVAQKIDLEPFQDQLEQNGISQPKLMSRAALQSQELVIPAAGYALLQAQKNNKLIYVLVGPRDLDKVRSENELIAASGLWMQWFDGVDAYRAEMARQQSVLAKVQRTVLGRINRIINQPFAPEEAPARIRENAEAFLADHQNRDGSPVTGWQLAVRTAGLVLMFGTLPALMLGMLAYLAAPQWAGAAVLVGIWQWVALTNRSYQAAGQGNLAVIRPAMAKVVDYFHTINDQAVVAMHVVFNMLVFGSARYSLSLDTGQSDRTQASETRYTNAYKLLHAVETDKHIENITTYLPSRIGFYMIMLLGLHRSPYPSIDQALLNWLGMPRRRAIKLTKFEIKEFLAAQQAEEQQALTAHRRQLAEQVNQYLNGLAQAASEEAVTVTRISGQQPYLPKSIDYARTLKLIQTVVELKDPGYKQQRIEAMAEGLAGQSEQAARVAAAKQQLLIQTRGAFFDVIGDPQADGYRLTDQAMDLFLEHAYVLPALLTGLKDPLLRQDYERVMVALFNHLDAKKLGKETPMTVLHDEIRRHSTKAIQEAFKQAVSSIELGGLIAIPTEQLESVLAKRLLYVIYDWSAAGQNYDLQTTAVATLMGETELSQVNDQDLYRTFKNNQQRMPELVNLLIRLLQKHVVSELEKLKHDLDYGLANEAATTTLAVYDSSVGRFNLLPGAIQKAALNTMGEPFEPVTFYLGDPTQENQHLRLKLYRREQFLAAVQSGDLPKPLKKKLSPKKLMGSNEPYVLVDLDIADQIAQARYQGQAVGLLEFGSQEKKELVLGHDSRETLAAFGRSDALTSSTARLFSVMGQVQIEMLDSQAGLWLPDSIVLFQAGQRADTETQPTQPQTLDQAALRNRIIDRLDAAPIVAASQEQLQTILELDETNGWQAWGLYEGAKKKMDALSNDYWYSHISNQSVTATKNRMIAAYLENADEKRLHRLMIDQDWLIKPSIATEAGQAQPAPINWDDYFAACDLFGIKPGYPVIMGNGDLKNQIRQIRHKLSGAMTGSGLFTPEEQALAAKINAYIEAVQRYIDQTKARRQALVPNYQFPPSTFQAQVALEKINPKFAGQTSTGQTGGNLVMIRNGFVTLVALFLPRSFAERAYNLLFAGVENLLAAGLVAALAPQVEIITLTDANVWTVFVGLHLLQSLWGMWQRGDAMGRYFWPSMLIAGIGLALGLNPIVGGIVVHLVVNGLLQQPAIRKLISRAQGGSDEISKPVRDLPGVEAAIEQKQYNTPLLAYNPIGRVIARHAEKMFKQPAFALDMLVQSGSKINRFKIEAAMVNGQERIVLELPNIYRRFLENQNKPQGLLETVRYWFLTWTLQINLNRAFNHYQRVNLTERADQQAYHQEEWMGRPLLKLPINGILNRFNRFAPISDFIKPSTDNRQIGVTTAQLVELLEAYRLVLINNPLTLWSVVEKELTKLLDEGQTPTSDKLVQALRIVDTKETNIPDPLLKRIIHILQERLDELEEDGNQEELAIEVNHIARLINRSRLNDFADATAAQPSQSVDQTSNDQIHVLAGPVKIMVQNLASDLAARLSNSTQSHLQTNLKQVSQWLDQEKMGITESRQLQQLLAATTQNRSTAAVIGETVERVASDQPGTSKAAGTVAFDKVDVISLTNEDGIEMQVAKPIIANVIAKDKATIDKLNQELNQDESTTADEVWLIPYQGYLPKPLKGNWITRILLRLNVYEYLQTSAVFGNKLGLNQAIAQTALQVFSTGRARQRAIRRLGRVLLRIMKVYVKNNGAAAFQTNDEFGNALKAVNQMVNQSRWVFGSSEVIGHYQEGEETIEVVAPVAFKTSEIEALEDLWNKMPGQFTLDEQAKRRIQKERLRNFRIESAA